MAKGNVGRHLKGVNEAALWLFREFSLGVKGRMEESTKAYCFLFGCVLFLFVFEVLEYQTCKNMT